MSTETDVKERTNLLIERLLRLSDSRQVLAYLTYAHGVTVIARETYPEVTDVPKPDLARECNETLHQLSGHPKRLLDGTSDAQSNRSFAEMVVQSAVQCRWLSLLERAVAHAESKSEMHGDGRDPSK